MSTSGPVARSAVTPATRSACGAFTPKQGLGVAVGAVRCVQAKWRLLETGRDGRSIVVEHGPVDACFGGPGRAVVTATAQTMRIRVYTWAGEGGLDMACTQRLVVGLGSPINGRRLLGQAIDPHPPGIRIDYLTRWVPDPPYPELGMPLVPRVVALSPVDALGVLRRQGFHPVLVGRGREVVRQRPARGQTAPGSTRRHPYGGAVQVTLGP